MTNILNKIDWLKVLIGITLLLSSISFILIAISLNPISKLAKYQNNCIEQESIKAPIEWAVRKCNGRSKVYQVK